MDTAKNTCQNLTRVCVGAFLYAITSNFGTLPIFNIDIQHPNKILIAGNQKTHHKMCAAVHSPKDYLHYGYDVAPYSFPFSSPGQRCPSVVLKRGPSCSPSIYQRSTMSPKSKSPCLPYRPTSAHAPRSTARPSAGSAMRTTQASTWTWTPCPLTERRMTCEHTCRHTHI